MDKKVIVSIKGNQRLASGEDNKIELVTEGRLYKKGNSYYLEYEETILSGMSDTKTLIAVEDKRVSLERIGSYSSQFVFEKGKRFINCYKTPFGELQMGVFPLQVDLNMDDTKGNLNLKYELDVAGKYMSLNELSLTYYENINSKAATDC